MRYPRTPLPLAAAALLAVLAGCGPTTPAATAPDPGTSATLPGFVPSGMPGMSMGAPAPSGAAASGPAPSGPDSSGPVAPGAPVDSVAIRNFAFAPATVTVKVGTTLTWTNSDQDPHTVTATGGAFRSPTLATGGTYRFTFTKPGRYDYLCTIHPFMTATVVVTP